MPAAKVETYKSPSKPTKRTQHRWRVASGNGRKLSGSSEGYNNEADMIKAMRLTRDALIAFLDPLGDA